MLKKHKDILIKYLKSNKFNIQYLKFYFLNSKFSKFIKEKYRYCFRKDPISLLPIIKKTF